MRSSFVFVQSAGGALATGLPTPRVGTWTRFQGQQVGLSKLTDFTGQSFGSRMVKTDTQTGLSLSNWPLEGKGAVVLHLAWGRGWGVLFFPRFCIRFDGMSVG